MAYTGISTRESRLEQLLSNAADRLKGAGHEQFANLLRDEIDKPCGIYTYRQSEVLSRGGVRIGQTYPCQLPAGHYGECNAEGEN